AAEIASRRASASAGPPPTATATRSEGWMAPVAAMVRSRAASAGSKWADPGANRTLMATDALSRRIHFEASLSVHSVAAGRHAASARKAIASSGYGFMFMAPSLNPPGTRPDRLIPGLRERPGLSHPRGASAG